MKHWTPAILFVLLSVGTAGALETDHSAPDRSSYDPMAHGKRAEQPKGMIETTLNGINPRNRNYGDVVEDWRQDVFGNTLRQIYFWGLIVIGMGLGISLAGNGWLLKRTGTETHNLSGCGHTVVQCIHRLTRQGSRSDRQIQFAGRSLQQAR